MGCHARINVLERKELLAQWLPTTKIGRVEQRLYREAIPDIVGVERLCRTFHLVPQTIPWAFDPQTWWPTSLRSVAKRMPSHLRFCRECIHQGYHSELFQLPWWHTCPIHREVLHEHCPNCAVRISAGLGLTREGEPKQLFHCRHCGFDLASSAAIVAASHDGVPDVLHRVVSVHRQWAHDVDARYLVPPVFGSDLRSLSREDALAFLASPQVRLPKDLQPFTEWVSSSRPSFPLWINVRAPKPSSPSGVWQLVHCLSAAPQVGTRRITLDSNQANRLRALERRLQRSLSPVARAQSNWFYKSRIRLSAVRHLYRPTKPVAATWEEGFLERGYRRRTYDMAVTGDNTLEIRDSELQRLTAVRLLLGLTAFLGTPESREPEQWPLQQIAEWWHNHFLVLALIDATIYATHANSYIDHNGNDPYLNRGWPCIGLDRIPPGHGWSIAATHQEDDLSAYIKSWPFGLVIDPERLRGREAWDRRQRLAQDLLTTVEIMKGCRPLRIYSEF